MLAEEMIGLASAAGTALVTAMVTDSWEGVRARFALLLGRGQAREAEIARARLKRSQDALAGLSGAALERPRKEQESVWRTRLSDFLELYPDAEDELRTVVAEVQALVIGSAAGVEQHVSASGHAQQAVQGQGIQINDFGGQRGRGISAG